VRFVPGLGKGIERPIGAGSDEGAQVFLLLLLDLGGSAGPGFGRQAGTLSGLPLVALHAGEGEAEPLSDLPLGLSALAGVDDTLAQVNGVGLHALKYRQLQGQNEEL